MAWIVLFLYGIGSACAVRINFTSCQQPEWTCANDVPNEIVYSCSAVKSNDFIIHLKDYYTDHLRSVTVQNCRDIRVVLDCPILQRASQLQQFKVKDCGRLEFVTLTSNSLIQTPPEVTIENVREVVSLPKKIFKSPITLTELKCLGSTSLKKIRIINTKINTINSQAIFNVSGIKSIEFENVTIANIEHQAITAIMGYDDTVFTIRNCNIYELNHSGITVQSSAVTIAQNTFDKIIGGSINITSDYTHITGNSFKEICANGLLIKSVHTDITYNDVNSLKRGALISVKCTKRKTNKKLFNFSRNRIENVEPHSVIFDYASCKSVGTAVTINGNKIDCTCRNINFLHTDKSNRELCSLFLDVGNNNTCLSAPCALPVDVVKLLSESDMCQLNLDPQVMCLLYNDKQTNNEATTDDDITEPAPTFYLIRQVNLRNGGASADITALDKDVLLRDSHFNMTNRTVVKVVFDSSRDFVETLRSTSTTHKRPEVAKVPSNEYVNRCVGSHCRSNAYDRQKALDFYKYVYAQLRPPRENDKKINT